MPKLWIGNKMYSVEGEVRDYADALQAENAKLREALEKYSTHPKYCQIHKTIGHRPELACSCGLEQALKEK